MSDQKPQPIEEKIEFAYQEAIKDLPEGEEFDWTRRMTRQMIQIRKLYELGDSLNRFREIIGRHLNDLHHLDHRNLHSVLDTYADHGDRSERAEAMLLCSFYMWTYLLGYQRGIVADGTYVDGALEEQGLHRTDKFANWMSRIDNTLVLQPMYAIWKIIKKDVVAGNFVIYKDLTEYSGMPFIHGYKSHGYKHLSHRN